MHPDEHFARNLTVAHLMRRETQEHSNALEYYREMARAAFFCVIACAAMIYFIPTWWSYLLGTPGAIYGFILFAFSRHARRCEIRRHHCRRIELARRIDDAISTHATR